MFANVKRKITHLGFASKKSLATTMPNNQTVWKCE